MSQLEAGNVNPISFRFARYGFNLLAIYWILRLFLNPDGFNVENIAVSLLLAASVTSLMLQVYLGNRRNQTYSQLDFVSRAALYALLLVCAITWLRGITTNPKQIITLLFNPIVGGTVWLLPIFVLIGTQKGVIQALLPMFYRHALYSLIFSFAALILFQVDRFELGRAATISAHLLLYAAYFILLAGLGSRSYRRLFFLALAAVTLCHLMSENRLHFMVGLSVLLVSLVTGNTRGKSRIWLRAIATFSFSIAAGLVALQLVSFALPDTWQTDTRTFLFEELIGDFSQYDLVFGRGAMGTYFSEYFYTIAEKGIEGGDAAVRQVSEVGYLHILLKAGLVGIAAIVLLKIRVLSLVGHLADYRLTFGATVFFLLHLLAMFIGYHLSFDSFQIFPYMIAGWIISEAKRNRKAAKP